MLALPLSAVKALCSFTTLVTHHLISLVLQVALRELLRGEVAPILLWTLVPLPQPLSCQILLCPAVLQVYPLSLGS
jgi:hypothetical protein